MAEENTQNQATAEKANLPQQFEIAGAAAAEYDAIPGDGCPARGRPRALDASGRASLATEEKLLACITTKTENVTGDDAKPDDLYKIGTIVNIKRMMRNEGIMQLIVQGMDRFRDRRMDRRAAVSEGKGRRSCPSFDAWTTKRSRPSNATSRA